MHILDSNSSNTLIQTPTGLPEALTLLSLLKDVEETFKSSVYILWQLQSSIIMLLLLVLQCFFKKHSSVPLLVDVSNSSIKTRRASGDRDDDLT